MCSDLVYKFSNFFYKYAQLSFSRTYLFTGRVLIHMSLATLISSRLTSANLPSQQIITAVSIKLFNPKITACTASFEVQNSAFLSQCIYVLCVCQNKRKILPYTAFSSWFILPRWCLLRGTNWVFKKNGLRFVLKVLRSIRNTINFLATQLHVNAACLRAKIH
jgi:hypothetical protein